MIHRLQWSTLERKMPVVYYGTESGTYSYVKTVASHLMLFLLLYFNFSNTTGCHYHIQLQ